MQTLQKIVLCLLCIGTSFSIAGDELQEVPIKDLERGATQIIGLLKLRIGTVADIQCEVVPDATVTKSRDSGFVRVLTVNGEAVSQVLFPLDQVVTLRSRTKVEILKGGRFKCRVFEGIQSIGIPEKAFDEGERVMAVSKAWNVYPILTIVQLID